MKYIGTPYEKTDSIGYASAFAFVVFLLLLVLSLVSEDARFFRSSELER
jgi:ABC-type sugar transport system permease subunit